MSIFRVFYFAITAGISGCLCKSVDKKKLNFFKVNAQPKTRGAEGGYGDHDWASDYSLDNICSKSGCIVESKDAPPRAEVGLLLTPKKEEFAREQFWLEHYKPLYPHPDYPDNWYIELGDFVIHYDSITYEPQYSMELVTKEKVTEINRRRCQTFRAGYDPEEYVSHKEIYEEDPKYLKAIQVAEKSSLGRKVEKELCGLSDSTPMRKGIGAFLCGSVSKRNNAFKVNAQPEPKDIPDDVCTYEQFRNNLLLTSCSEGGGGAICGGTLMSSSPIKAKHLNWARGCDCEDNTFHNPNISDLDGHEITVCRNCTGIPNWTLQHLSTDKVSESDHHNCRYCLALRFPGAETCAETPVNIDAYCVADVDPCVFQIAPPRAERSAKQNNSLWDDFYHYVLFLAQKYENIWVCSAPFIKKQKIPDEEKHLHPDSDTTSELTHFFKIILTEDRRGLFRFDCYMIENKPIAIEHPDLHNYRIMKTLAEIETCLFFFPEIRRRFIGAKKVHGDFCPHRNCPCCFPTASVMQSNVPTISIN
uniref:ENPP1-3/EXOG-like endonuclease/phosphodiesterase domain-containing protein n=1 Tax=Strigamia maritima TaxID=126957 RepID=T1IX15_STRMM